MYTHRLGRYPQTIVAFYGVEEGLPSGSIHGLAVDADGSVWAATEGGLAVWDGNTWCAPKGAGALPEGHARQVFVSRKGEVWATVAGALFRYDQGAWVPDLAENVIAMAEDESGRVWAVSPERLFALESDGQWYVITKNEHFNVRDIAAFGDRGVVLATDRGVQRLYGKERPGHKGQVRGPSRDGWKELIAGRTGSVSDDIRSLFADDYGHVWIASDSGIMVYDGKSAWHAIRSDAGLPYEDITVIVPGPNGERWLGTPEGAIRYHEGRWKFFGSQRWLPDRRVQAIACHPGGDVWIGTSNGLSRLSFPLMSLEEKAERYDQITQTYHKRLNYVSVRILDRAGDLASGRVEVSDNDGLWTAMYIVAQACRYAVTKDPEARELARASMEALLHLVDVTERPGFPARAVQHKSEPGFGLHREHPEWHLTSDGEWEWRGDTSSDEMVGHYHAYAFYYDLVADEEERGRIRDVVRAVTDHIVDNGYYLIDVDEAPTTWAVWAPERLNDDDAWWPERGCNSLEILSFLKTAFHITGEARYEEAYRDLIQKSHYAMNTIRQKIDLPIGRVSHIDDKLAFLSYTQLLRYETSPDLRALYFAGLEHHWQYERTEGNPLYNVIYGGLTGRAWDGEAAIQNLAELPLDMIHWPVKNSHRKDIEIDREVEEIYGVQQLVRPLPADERPMHRGTSSPYGIDGGNGLRAEDPTTFLHPYWLGRYYGVIEERESTTDAGTSSISSAPDPE